MDYPDSLCHAPIALHCIRWTRFRLYQTSIFNAPARARAAAGQTAAARRFVTPLPLPSGESLPTNQVRPLIVRELAAGPQLLLGQLDPRPRDVRDRFGHNGEGAIAVCFLEKVTITRSCLSRRG
jgi:hypothetical protein